MTRSLAGIGLPLVWLGGCALGILGTGALFQAVTTGSGVALLWGLAGFVPGLYLAGWSLARARTADRRQRPRRPAERGGGAGLGPAPSGSRGVQVPRGS